LQKRLIFAKETYLETMFSISLIQSNGMKWIESGSNQMDLISNQMDLIESMKWIESGSRLYSPFD